MARIWIPLPDTDFDVTEVAVPWKLLRSQRHSVVFVTENGDGPARCDPTLLTDLWWNLGAEDEPRAFYDEMIASEEFQNPMSWNTFDPTRWDGLILPGGHAPGMKQYLGSEVLQQKIATFWRMGKPLGAICHGVLPLARAKDPDTGDPLLRGRKSTCLPRFMELAAYLGTFWNMGSHYRTYPAYVEAEVREALGPDGTFDPGPFNLRHKGTGKDHTHAFVVEDGNYVSARWPGDAYLFANKFLERL